MARPSRPRVLVVDDEPIVRRFAAQVLAAAGYDVVTAVDGREGRAIAAHAEAAIELVLTDIRMPNLDGLELGRALETLRPGLPVIYMSGFGPPALIAESPNLPFIVKPFDPDQLVAQVQRLLPPPPDQRSA